MTPTLDFLERNPGLMAEMISDFQQRKKIVDMAKTKEPVDANVIDNPNLRAFIPYPKLMYNHATRQTLTVHDGSEHQAANQAGWKEQPWPAIDPGVPIGPQTISDPMADERMDSLEQRMLMLEQGLAEILGQLQGLNRPEEKRRPGRPPLNREE